jgi:prostaglandin-E synthase
MKQGERLHSKLTPPENSLIAHMSQSNVPVKWAQRKDKLFVTLDAISATGVSVEFADSSITVSGTNGATKAPFLTKLSLFKPIDPAGSSYKVLGPCIQVAAKKAESAPHWDKLVVEPTKQTKNWLSCDWSLWKDEEDEKADERVDFGGYGDMGNMMNFGGAGGDMNFGGGDEGGADSDDEAGEAPAASDAADLKDLDN